MLNAAAATFAITPCHNSEGRTLLGNKAGRIFSPLQSSVIVLDDGPQRVVLLTSHFMTHHYRVSNIFRDHVARTLGLERSQVLVFSSHNHCTVKLVHPQYSLGLDEHDFQLPDDQLTSEGQTLLAQYVRHARLLVDQLEPVEVRYGKGQERRISHNRKGRRADGSAYLMREEDRLLLGQDFNGDIDDDAFVVGFFNAQNKPVCFLTQFTAHPVTAYHCDHPVVHGEFPQVACDDLSNAYEGVPVAFLQGCAGDTNSKGLLANQTPEQNAQDADRYGHMLGQTFIDIAKNLTPASDARSTSRDSLALLWQWTAVPFKEVPPLVELKNRLAAVDDFIARCDAGDMNTTRFCDGLNFPSNMSVPYRKALIAPVKRWLQWAMDFHLQDKLHEAPKEIKIHMAALRIGPVGIVGMPCEPLLGVGRQIKRDSPLAFTIPCGYMNDTSYGYIPDGANCDDSEYMSQFCRYTTTLLPYKKPAGDTLAQAGVRMLIQSLEPQPQR